MRDSLLRICKWCAGNCGGLAQALYHPYAIPIHICRLAFAIPRIIAFYISSGTGRVPPRVHKRPEHQIPRLPAPIEASGTFLHRCGFGCVVGRGWTSRTELLQSSLLANSQCQVQELCCFCRWTDFWLRAFPFFYFYHKTNYNYFLTLAVLFIVSYGGGFLFYWFSRFELSQISGS